MALKPSSTPSSPIFKDLRLLKLSNIFKYKLLIVVFDYIHGNVPACFNKYYFLGSSVHQYSIRQARRDDFILSKKTPLSMI